MSDNSTREGFIRPDLENLTPSMVDTSDEESICPSSRQSDSSFSPTNDSFKPPPRPTTKAIYTTVVISSDEEEDDNKMSSANDKQATSDCSFSPERLGNVKLNSSNEKSPDDGVEAMEITTNVTPILRPGPMFQWGVGPDDPATKKRLPEDYIESESKKRNIMDDDYDLPVPVVAPEKPATPEPVVVKLKGVVKMIAGVNVEFPLNPYPSQVAVMNAMIRACKSSENALLESPTGSGKTLALLCGALSWQRQYTAACNQKLKEYKDMIQKDVEHLDFPSDDSMEEEAIKKNLEQIDSTIKPPDRPPKIFYGSRTHRQITQVVKELRKTAYRDAKMTILSSREFTCIQETKRNKTEFCNELLDPVLKKGCPYYSFDSSNRAIVTHEDIPKVSMETPFDIEDLVTAGRNHSCCPYFAARDLMQHAEIIFCPYNYLIDPAIRKSMSITLNNNIVILDEAHNIEDICREAGSSSIKATEIEDIIKDCNNFSSNFKSNVPCPPFVAKILSFCTIFNKFLQSQPLVKKPMNTTAFSRYWKGPEFVQKLEINNLKLEKILEFTNACQSAIDHQNKAKEEARDPRIGFKPTMSPLVIRILDKFIFAFGSITQEHSADYVIYIKEVIEWSRAKVSDSDYTSSRATKQAIRVIDYLCMNPGVVFKPMSDMSRSVILASGTLSPISSFSSELQTKFAHPLQTNHVTPKTNVFVRAIPRGPSGDTLRANYASVQTWKFQDEVGRTIYDICASVPYGVLCFFSSYSVLNKITERMNTTGLMERTRELKSIYEEPRTNEELGQVMIDYRNDCQKKGALLFAVFRGKVAEGIDFSDNEARAVITIGIPYSVRADPAVECKLAYNDQYSVARGLLRGGEWYNVNAFRALNQALGRCIRHREDWGAIIMIDDRFQASNCHGYLPKWILGMWANRSFQYQLPHELKRFVQDRIEFYERKNIEDV